MSGEWWSGTFFRFWALRSGLKRLRVRAKMDGAARMQRFFFYRLNSGSEICAGKCPLELGSS